VFVGFEAGWAEIFELCYIPVFGGGFGFGYEEAVNMTASERRRALNWLEDRKNQEKKAFKGGSGSGSSPSSLGIDPPESMIAGPKMTTPQPPTRS